MKKYFLGVNGKIGVFPKEFASFKEAKNAKNEILKKDKLAEVKIYEKLFEANDFGGAWESTGKKIKEKWPNFMKRIFKNNSIEK